MFTLTTAQLASVASLVNVAEKGGFTPVLEYVRITVESGMLTAIATDRYIVGRVTFPLEDSEASADAVYVHRDVLTAAAKTANASTMSDKRGTVVTVTPAELAVDRFGQTTRYALAEFTLNFPPVERLIPEEYEADLQAGIRLDVARLTRISKIALPDGDKRNDGVWDFATTPGDPSQNRAVIMTRDYGTASALALIQPSNRRR